MTKHTGPIAELNVAKMRFSYDDPRMADFIAEIDAVNADADRHSGFIWRYDSAVHGPVSPPFPADWLINYSVWESVAALRDYIFTGGHLEVMQKKRTWFDKLDQPHLVIWPVADGHIPSAQEAWERLETLRAEGPGPEAFTFARAGWFVEGV